MFSLPPMRLFPLMTMAVLAFFACDRQVLLGVEGEGDGAGGSGGAMPSGQGGLGAAASGSPVCGDSIPEGENEQCDEGGGTQTCTVDCQFRGRVSEGLILFYTFEERAGNQIFDRSGFGAPLNLTIPDTGAITWNSASLELESPVLIESTSPAEKLTDAIQSTSQFTLEAWIVPANLEQDGPARIVTVSQIEFRRNVTLAQDVAQIVGRVRTTETGDNGFPELRTDAILEPGLVHLVFSHQTNGDEVIYVNAEEQVRRNLAGDFSTWDPSFHLALGAEFNEDLESRDFLGTMHLIAMYSRALSEAEILQNFEDGP